jgi:hypothetical protein
MAPRNKILTALVVVAGSVAGALYVRRQAATEKGERVDLYYPDGTLMELGPQEATAAELLGQGREILSHAPSGGS